MTHPAPAPPAGALLEGTAVHTEDEPPQLRARLANAATPTEPVGYMIVGPNRDGELEADWDGVVHPTVEAGQAQLAKCREFYPGWFLCALVPKETP